MPSLVGLEVSSVNLSYKCNVTSGSYKMIFYCNIVGLRLHKLFVSILLIM